LSFDESHCRKEVTAMTYAKPEIMKIADATAAICLDSALSKSMAGADLSNPHQMTPPAYSADEE
jgi:hypothetical protein